MALRKMNAGEFARRLRADSEMPDKRFAFFIGAGCSITSGIPAAGTLVKYHWLPKLRDYVAPDEKDIEAWAKKDIHDYDPNNPAGSYGPVMERLFLNPEDRQREIERLCDGKFPGFGYAVLASLIAKDDGCFNVLVTTNFDDLVSDALYLYTRSRPLVIGHESLAGYIRPTRTRPLVVKLHGDARLSPQNTAAETANIQDEVESQVRTLLYDRGLIFMGYGGNDQGITEMLSTLPKEALPLGIYWINGAEPQGVLAPWLEERSANWVEKFDFDEMMLLIRDAFELPHPDEKPFSEVFQHYGETYQKLSERIRSAPADATDEATKKAVDRADSDLSGWLTVLLKAQKLEKTDPEEANNQYQGGIEEYPNSSPLLSAYALFLERTLKEFDKAEQCYELAIEADPNNKQNLENYANFLKAVRKKYELADMFFRRIIHVDPNRDNTLGAYAFFLEEVRKEFDQAEQFYHRAIEADPTHVTNIVNYANFLIIRRQEYDRAEQLFQRALEIDPKHAGALGGYANFLRNIRKEYDQAEQFFQRSIEANPKSSITLVNYANFLADTRNDYNKAEPFYQRAIEADPNNANSLHWYAVFLSQTRKDYKKAEQYYQRSFDSDPNHKIYNSNYAGFALAHGKKDKGLHLLERAILFLPDPEELAVEIWFYAFAHWPPEKRNEALINLKNVLLEGQRSAEWDLSGNVEQARKDKHPDIQWVEKLAAVINEEEDISVLDEWDAWKEA